MRIFLSGPSGVGKSTIIAAILQRNSDLILSVSYTTRPPRKRETEGKDYFFITKEQFEEMIEKDAFLEWAHVHNHLYGTSLSWIESTESSGRHILFDIDVQGVRQAQEKGSPGSYIFIVPPNMEALKDRLGKRGTEDASTMKTRLDNARHELMAWERYDFLVANNEIEKAVADIQSIIDACRCSRTEAIKRLPWLQKIG